MWRTVQCSEQTKKSLHIEGVQKSYNNSNFFYIHYEMQVYIIEYNPFDWSILLNLK